MTAKRIAGMTVLVIPGVVQHAALLRRPGIAKNSAAFVIAGLDPAIRHVRGSFWRS